MRCQAKDRRILQACCCHDLPSKQVSELFQQPADGSPCKPALAGLRVIAVLEGSFCPSGDGEGAPEETEKTYKQPKLPGISTERFFGRGGSRPYCAAARRCGAGLDGWCSGGWLPSDDNSGIGLDELGWLGLRPNERFPWCAEGFLTLLCQRCTSAIERLILLAYSVPSITCSAQSCTAPCQAWGARNHA